MTDCVSLPLEAHDNISAFLKHAWNIGRAYRNQALELISICQLFSRIAPPKLVHEDAELRRYLNTSSSSHICLPTFTISCRIIRACDLALRSAADSGAKVTEEANARFKEATRLLTGHSGRRNCLWVKIPLVFDDLRPSINSHSRRDLPLTVYSRMEIAKVKDSVQRDQPYIVEPTMTIYFVLLQSPFPAPHDPEPVVLSRERQFIRAL